MSKSRNERIKMKRSIRHASSLEEYASGLQCSAGLRGAIRAVDKESALEALGGPVTDQTNELVQKSFIEYIGEEIADILFDASFFFSPEPEKALLEIRELLYDDSVSQLVIKELARRQRKQQKYAIPDDLTEEEKIERAAFSKVEKAAEDKLRAEFEKREAEKVFEGYLKEFNSKYPDKAVSLEDFEN